MVGFVVIVVFHFSIGFCLLERVGLVLGGLFCFCICVFGQDLTMHHVALACLEFTII